MYCVISIFPRKFVLTKLYIITSFHSKQFIHLFIYLYVFFFFVVLGSQDISRRVLIECGILTRTSVTPLNVIGDRVGR